MTNIQVKSKWIQKYLLDGLSAMAMGLFATLIVGVIVKTLGEQLLLIPSIEPVAQALIQIGGVAMSLMGAGIAVAIASRFNATGLVLFASIVAGQVGALYGGPAGAYLAAVFAIELGFRVSKKTALDIIVTPLVVILSGYLMAITGGQLIGWLMDGLGFIIMEATNAQPILMGIIIAVLMGMALTAPISSAALAIMLGLSGIAAGAATVGCCAQMVGFATMGRKENPFGVTIAVGLGTSMLQIRNIILNPWIWVPPTLTAAILGPFATTFFAMENLPAGAGMGTSGLVGPILTITAMGLTADIVLKILVLYILLPILLTTIITLLFKKAGKIKKDDCKITFEQ
jgi:uncharacterized membrane protein